VNFSPFLEKIITKIAICYSIGHSLLETRQQLREKQIHSRGNSIEKVTEIASVANYSYIHVRNTHRKRPSLLLILQINYTVGGKQNMLCFNNYCILPLAIWEYAVYDNRKV
jgi:hypothetical protein